MSETNPLLNSIRIAAPCTADWEKMSGDEKSRFCQDCKLNVHNLSAMTAQEAEFLLNKQKEGQRVCVTFFRRADGTVLTQDCPVGLKKLKENAFRTWRRVASFVSAFICFSLAAQANPSSHDPSLKTGIAAYQKQEYKQAVEFFRGVVAKNPLNDQARYYLALSLQSLADLAGAREQFRLILQNQAPSDFKLEASKRLQSMERTLNSRETGEAPVRLMGEPMPPPSREMGKMVQPQNK
ncbi:MAG: tetratricopeptide repeat protein [Candidatus Obscuribacterales bacterium]|nr:tetratricopeptide repeat protein [Candidatus Obscuribacterales bacterium]